MSSDRRVPPSHLETSDDAELAWRLIEPACAVVNIYDGPKALAVDLMQLSPGQRALLALHLCVSEEDRFYELVETELYRDPRPTFGLTVKNS